MMKTKTERIKVLRTQQKRLMARARETAEATRRRIKREYADELKRIKLYKSKESQKRALQTKKLGKRKSRKVRRRRKIIAEVDAMFE